MDETERKKLFSEYLHPTKSTARPRGTDSAKVIQVIVTESLAGRGTDEDPCYIQERYWSFDGKLIAIGVSDPRLSE